MTERQQCSQELPVGLQFFKTYFNQKTDVYWRETRHSQFVEIFHYEVVRVMPSLTSVDGLAQITLAILVRYGRMYSE
jgi:hypothetical protein